MRNWPVLLLIALLLLAASPLNGQAEKAAPPAVTADTRPAELLKELSARTFTAKRAIPTSDGIFVENGRVVEALFALGRQENPIAIAAGKTATVSKVLLLDKALHVFLAGDKCGLLILTREDKPTADMKLPELRKLALEGLGALFTEGEQPKKPTT
jgi:hypothetical protein